MNEQIKKLAEQAGYTTDMFGIGHWDMPECKKFAELIVNECADIAQQHNKSPVKSIYAVGHVIREHFGVEE
jgi:hypothetical protein